MIAVGQFHLILGISEPTTPQVADRLQEPIGRTSPNAPNLTAALRRVSKAVSSPEFVPNYLY